MIATIVYSFLLGCMTIAAFRHRSGILGRILCIEYFVVSIFSVLTLKYNYQTVFSINNLTILPYIFLILAYCIFFFPFLGSGQEMFNVKKTNVQINGLMNLYSIVYIICTIVSVRCMYPYVLRLRSIAAWGAARDEIYASGNVVFPYSNIIEHIAIFVSLNLVLLSVIFAFIYLVNNSNKKNLIIGFALLLCTSLSVYCESVFISSRGLLSNYAILVFSLICFFYNGIGKTKRKTILILAILGVVIVTPYIIEVTTSRFRVNALGSVIEYLGHAPLVFNSGVAGSINRIAFGEYSLGALFGINSFSQNSIGGNWGSSFYTFVGWLYIDWGPIGTILIGIIISYLIRYVMRKEIISLCDLYIVFFYFFTLAQGVFVIGRSYIITIIQTVVIYCLLKLFFGNYTFKIGERRIIDSRDSNKLLSSEK